ncbi:hypothetical protein PF007_g16398 [Phytophthora fragariae]|uniref:Uncharacterized protein n=1 Tax=Phytophthora fragariae TaxID=53985 RepID=A0A6A3RIY7_9STRA|nr:hypothetical protein PF003_g36288 [Phytophthora fragariae]KAE8935895.1 hypothetical protein PF009_g14167 [Phytophthora fragariae]KAE9098070.1 hypothetical protein PF007_g16398 [Phytophthora fragariae]KAE9306267.1 hypothetical protein PF001_g12209 [Phytophthora fragariae]
MSTPGEAPPLSYPGFGVSVWDESLLTSSWGPGRSTSVLLGGSFGVLGSSFAEPFFFGGCLAAGFFTAGFFGTGFEEAVTFFALRGGFDEAGVFFAFVFALVAETVSFLEAGGSSLRPRPSRASVKPMPPALSLCPSQASWKPTRLSHPPDRPSVSLK